MKRIAIAVLVCTTAACQPHEPARDAAASADAVRPEPAVAALPDVQDSAAGTRARVLLALDGAGLRVVLGSTGSTRLLAFGMESKAAIAAVTSALGPPISRGTNADCGAGPMEFVVFADGLTMGIQKQRFVGWSARATGIGGALSTMSGVGVGSTRAALDSTYAADVGRSTLGVEWVAGGIAGVLDGESSTARVTDMWAGANCVAR